MSKARVYLAAGSSRAVERRIPDGDFARVAFNGCGDGSRTLEVYMDPRGVWSVSNRPGPAHGGGTVEIARGCLPTTAEFTGGPLITTAIHVDPLASATDLNDIRRRLAALDEIKDVINDEKSIGKSDVDVDRIISILAILDGTVV